jgi:uncharacterized membrane protein
MKYLRFMILVLFIVGLISVFPFSGLAKSTGSDSKTLAVDNMVSANGDASYRLLIRNDDLRPHKYTLSYGLLPKKLQVNFNMDGRAIKELELKAQQNIIVGLNIKMPAQSSAGTTVIDIESKRDDGRVYALPVSVTVNRDYSLLITNQIKGLNVITGQDLSFDVSVLNNGKKNLNNIKLSVDFPYKWILQGVNPSKLSLKPGENGLYIVKVSIPPSQVSGNNIIKASAVSDSITSPKVEIPVSVQNNPNYLFWVIGLIALTGAGTLLYFRKHGRR